MNGMKTARATTYSAADSTMISITRLYGFGAKHRDLLVMLARASRYTISMVQMIVVESVML